MSREEQEELKTLRFKNKALKVSRSEMKFSERMKMKKNELAGVSLARFHPFFAVKNTHLPDIRMYKQTDRQTYRFPKIIAFFSKNSLNLIFLALKTS